MTNEGKLNILNTFRKDEGLAPLKDWRQARHQPMLDAYNEKQREWMARHEAKQVEAERQKQDAPKPKPEPKKRAAKKADAPAPVQTLKDAIKQHDFADSRISEAAKADKTPSYKAMANYAKSSVDKPVAFIHQFCLEHPDLTRKQTIAALMEYGINFSTARTQYQRWFKEHKAKKGA